MPRAMPACRSSGSLLTLLVLIASGSAATVAQAQKVAPVSATALTAMRLDPTSWTQQQGCTQRQEGSTGETGSDNDSRTDDESQRGHLGKRVTATRTSTPPVLDGIVDENTWDRAEVVIDFLQRDPDNGAPASERTEVRILYDDENLYVGFILHDRDPSGIIATDLRRDSRGHSDDTVTVILDTYNDDRNGYMFRVNSLGAKWDAMVQNERDMNSQWDEKWEAAAQITERGWEAELEIPWKAMRYPAGSHDWGIDFRREIRRKNEEVNWSNYQRGYHFTSISQAGTLVGLENLNLTQRFRVKPYFSGEYTALNASDTPVSESNGDFGLDVFKFQVTPNLTADLTINPDFAQVEDDQERVNLTRFPLFFPERREFFLESANNFAFGTSRRHDYGTPLASLFFSRRIGLSNGMRVPITFGARLTGKVGGSTIGFINAQTGNGEHGNGSNYSALRWRQDLFGRSSVGAVMTNVLNSDGDYNRVFGIDTNFRFFEYLTFGGFVAQARDKDIDGGSMLGRFGVGWNDDLWMFNADYTRIDEDFNTDLGFIQRRDIQRRNINVGWRPRPDIDWLRQVSTWTSIEYITDTLGNFVSRDQAAAFRVSFQSGDSFNISYSNNYERLVQSFSVTGQGDIPAGDHEWNTWRLSLNTYSARQISVRLNASTGGFYNGDRTSWGGGGSVRFSENFSLSPSYSYNVVTLPGTSFTTHVGSLRSSYNFSDRWLTNALVQYNSLSERLSIFARLNYIYRTGDDIFLVFKQASIYDGTYAGRHDRGIVLKMTRSFDF